jgi:ubiquinone/menaquinone biosynthesis C-methylase UbiE
MHGAEQDEQQRLEVLAELVGGASFLPDFEPGMRILEAGSGTGAIARRVAPQIAPGEVVGVDRESAQVEAARTAAARQGIDNVRFLVGDLTTLSLDEEPFDGAYCRFVLEHVADPIDAIRRLAAHVRAGGWVCAYEWNNASFSVFPACPAVRLVWDAIYRLQDQLGGDANVALKLLGCFRRAGLGEVAVRAEAFTFTGNGGGLEEYVNGARLIIDEARDDLLERRLASENDLHRADQEYEALLTDPGAIVIEVMCCATGIVL